MSKIDKLLAGAALAGTAYVLSIKGRTGHPGLKKLQGWNYAHRGLHGEGVPENSMKAFRLAVEQGYGAELDVHLLADGNLAVIHDSKLIRTTGAEGRIEDLTADQLKDYHLEGTEETIPLFSDVLALFEGKAPLIIELKVENNNEQLCTAVAKLLDHYKGDYCVESFHPQVLGWFKKYRPNTVRGQLTENYFRSKDNKLPPALKFILTHQLLNFATSPDFVAYNCRDLDSISNTVARKVWNMQGVTWTLRTREQYDEAVDQNWLPIFENFKP